MGEHRSRRRLKDTGVVGVDLSAKRAAAVYLPANWEPGSWEGVCYLVMKGLPVVGRDPKASQERIAFVVGGLYSFVHDIDARDGEPSVFLEDYAYGLAGNAGMVLGEIGGAFKYVMAEDDILVTPINVSTARKVLLGKIPRGKGAAAAAVHSVIQRMSPPWGEGSDEGDAFCVANAGRNRLGLLCVALW